MEGVGTYGEFLITQHFNTVFAGKADPGTSLDGI
jgi:hypothetical protein